MICGVQRPKSELAVRQKVEEFRIALQNRYSALTEQADICLQEVSDNPTRIVTECAIEVEGKIATHITSKLSQDTKDLIRKRQGMIVSNATDRIELVELPKLISKRKTADIRKHIMKRIEHALKSGRRLKALKRRLGIGKNQTYALQARQGNVITNREEVVV